MSKLKRTLLLALLSGVAAVLGVFESMLPIFPAIPGGKLGIANIVTLVVLYIFGGVSAIIVSTVRTIISCMLYGGLNAFIYSFSGAIFSTVVMIGMKKVFSEKISPIGISVTGAACHNTAQVAVAWLVLRSNVLFQYLGALLFIGLVSGAVCGWVSYYCTDRIKGLIK